jgi:cytochrome b6-f complex iron-sulfur subunit
MNRKEFLSQIGLGTAGIVAFSCLESCSKSAISAPSNVNFTVDTSAPANAALLQNGGYIYSNGIIIAKTITGSYIAVSQTCTHQGASVVYDGTNNVIYCPAHSSVFSDSGTVINGPAGSPLKQYTVSVNGNILTITG